MFEQLPDIPEHFVIIIPASFTALFLLVNPVGSGILSLYLTPRLETKQQG
jgi:hypothetical protein